MSYVVAFYFDTKSEAKIKEIWQALVSKTEIGSSQMHRPHISVVVFDSEELDIKPIKKQIKKLAKSLKSFRLELSHFAYFTNQETIFLAPKVNKRLLSSQAKLYKKLIKHSKNLSIYSESKIWIPHCSLLYKLSPEGFILAIKKTKNINLPISIKIEEIGFVKVSPEGAESIYTKKF